MTARILVLCGSTRPGSPTALLAGEAARVLSLTDAAVTLVSLADYPLPVFDRDAAAAGDGLPQNALLLGQRIAMQDALLLVSPEVDGAMPALVKNMLEWTSRLQTATQRAVRPYARLVTGLAGTSENAGGGAAGTAALRLALQALGAEILTRQCNLAHAATAFDETGGLLDAAARADLEALAESLLDHSRALGRHV